MDDGEFEWDDAKAAKNLREHRVSFETARRVFGDPFAIDWRDVSEAYGEHRYVTIGVVDDRLFYVAYTMRDETKTRIISAREANPRERRRYHEEGNI